MKTFAMLALALGMTAGAASAQDTVSVEIEPVQTQTRAENVLENAGDAAREAGREALNAAEAGAEALGEAASEGATRAGNAAQRAINEAGEAVDRAGNALADAVDDTAPAVITTDTVVSTADDTAGGSHSVIGQDTLSADELIGSAIFAPSDTAGSPDANRPADWERVAEIGDVLFTHEDGVIGYVADVGGFLGIGTKRVVLSPDSLQSAAFSDGDVFTIRMSKDEIQALPEHRTE